MLSCAMRFFERGTQRLSRAINSIGVGFLAVMMFLTGTDVTLRYIFNRPIAGAYELTELMMVILVFWGLSYTQFEKGHVAIELVFSRLPKRAQAIVDIIVYCLCLGLFALLVWQSVVQAKDKLVSGLVTGTLLIPVWPFYLAEALGCIIMCFVLFVDLLGSLNRVTMK
jgi:TRAP-type C4-dicarboxylate transport system permease small subunit